MYGFEYQSWLICYPQSSLSLLEESQLLTCSYWLCISFTLSPVTLTLVTFTLVTFSLHWLGMGWFKKSCSLKVEKKCNENWRWPNRELKTLYMWNNITVSIFPKKNFSYFDSFSWYSHLNVWFWQFWPSPNIFKTCIEIVLFQYFLLQKFFYPK